MPTPDEYRRAMARVTAEAVNRSNRLLAAGLTVDELLGAVPLLIDTYADATAALAADQYDELRDDANPPGTFRAEPVVEDRPEKVRRGILWAVEPAQIDAQLAASRLEEVVQIETARPFRTTILENTKRDPQAVGWRRHSSGDTCPFCMMLAGRGAVYRESSARFASHPRCDCTASPAFATQGPIVEASVLQYVASQRRRTPAQREALRRYLATLPA